MPLPMLKVCEEIGCEIVCGLAMGNTTHSSGIIERVIKEKYVNDFISQSE